MNILSALKDPIIDYNEVVKYKKKIKRNKYGTFFKIFFFKFFENRIAHLMFLSQIRVVINI